MSISIQLSLWRQFVEASDLFVPQSNQVRWKPGRPELRHPLRLGIPKVMDDTRLLLNISLYVLIIFFKLDEQVRFKLG
jgi:hypothetical protein